MEFKPLASPTAADTCLASGTLVIPLCPMDLRCVTREGGRPLSYITPHTRVSHHWKTKGFLTHFSDKETETWR